MKRKILKYIKTFLSLVIISSFIISSYAKSGEQEAFITKAEFDSLTQEIYKEMDILEATINSKIDLQITSYLDRNGIWSASNQVSEVPCYGVQMGSSVFNMGSFTSGNYHKKYCEFTLVDKINKTGLMHIKVEGKKGKARDDLTGGKKISESEFNTYTSSVDAKNGYSLTFYNWNYTETSRVADLYMRGAMSNHIYFYVNGVLNADKTFAQSYAGPVKATAIPSTYTTFNERGVTLVTEEFDFDLFFFIYKDDKLSFDLTYEMLGYYYGSSPYLPRAVATDADVVGGTTYPTDKAYFYIRFNDVSVY